MKKVLIFITLTLVFLMCFVSCKEQDEHVHQFGEWSVTKNSTCAEDGVKTRYCDCGEKQSDTIPLTGHNYVGNACIDCGYIKETTECRHENVDVLSAKEATCTESGLTEGIVCLDCGETIQHQNTVKALDHYLNNYTEKDENCKVLHITVCLRENCDYYISRNTDTVEHLVAEWQLITNIPEGMSPCLVNTDYFGVCVDCGTTQTKSEFAPGCLFNENSEVFIVCPPTDVSEGEFIVICARCHQGTHSEKLPVLSLMDYTTTVMLPTCVDHGTIEYTYNSSYGTSFTFFSYLEALGHNYVDNICLDCGDVKETSECRHENVETIPEVSPTCTETGLTEGKNCSDCGKILVAQTTIAATGHSFGEWITVKEASATEEGLKEKNVFVERRKLN